MSKRTAVVVSLNKRQLELIENLDPLYGDTLDEKLQTIIVRWLCEYPHLYDEDAD